MGAQAKSGHASLKSSSLETIVESSMSLDHPVSYFCLKCSVFQ